MNAFLKISLARSTGETVSDLESILVTVPPKARFLAAYAEKKAVKQPNRACMAERLRIL